MKIIFEPSYWKAPANGLVAAVQKRLLQLLRDADESGIRDANTLKETLLRDIVILGAKHPRCSTADLNVS